MKTGKDWLKNKKDRKALYLILGVSGVVIVGWTLLLLSMKSYKLSMNREEVKIAQMGGEQSVEFPKDGEVRFYYFAGGGRLIKLKYKDKVHEYITSQNQSGQHIDTDIVVASGDKMTIEVYEGSGFNKKAYGWIPAPEDKKCSGRDVTVDEEAVLSKGESIVLTQCWNDWENYNNPNMDFNDFVIIFSYTPDGANSAGNILTNVAANTTAGGANEINSNQSEGETVSEELAPEENFVPSQPDTGVPTWLTVGSLVLVGLLGISKVLLRY